MRTQVIILIGAARSGTKLVRNLISVNDAVNKVPYDINYLWRLGNEKLEHDELKPESLTPELRNLIRYKIKKLKPGSPYLIEKTVSNCLRVEFVKDIFPEAKFIHLVRNARDVIESAYRQWLAPPDWQYIINKAITFPLIDAFGYGVSYAKKTLGQILPSAQRQPAIWGPRYQGIQQDLEEKELLEVCAIQYLKCLQGATDDLVKFGQNYVYWLRYEDFVKNPWYLLREIAEFLQIAPSPYKDPFILKTIQKGNIGKGERNLNPDQMMLIKPYIERADQLLSWPEVSQRLTTPEKISYSSDSAIQ